MLNHEILKKFLTNTDETGRFIVYSHRTGKRYFVEPIGYCKTNWGSIDPEDSLITETNGFKNIKLLDPGTSPLAYIDFIDAKYPDKA